MLGPDKVLEMEDIGLPVRKYRAKVEVEYYSNKDYDELSFEGEFSYEEDAESFLFRLKPFIYHSIKRLPGADEITDMAWVDAVTRGGLQEFNHEAFTIKVYKTGWNERYADDPYLLEAQEINLEPIIDEEDLPW